MCRPNETLSDDVLFFVLEENYGENDLTLSRLRGKDTNLGSDSQILQISGCSSCLCYAQKLQYGIRR